MKTGGLNNGGTINPVVWSVGRFLWSGWQTKLFRLSVVYFLYMFRLFEWINSLDNFNLYQ